MAAAKEKGEFEFTPAARTNASCVAACPDEGWQRVFAFLSLREVTRSAFALLSNKDARDTIGNAFDPHVVLNASWSKGVGGLDLFVAVARAAYLAQSVFSKIPRTDAGPTYRGIQPRSVVVSGEPSALAFSRGEQPWEGLLAIAIGREVKLVQRDDMKSCGVIALALPKGCREVGSMLFSPDNSTLAVIPMGDSGDCAPEIQFYATEEKSKPVVTKMRGAGKMCFDFLHAETEDAGGTEDLVVGCGMELFQVSPSTGGIVATWKDVEHRSTFSSCKAISPHEVITLSGKAVEIWDVRTAKGLVQSAHASEIVTALDTREFSRSSTTTYLGDAIGGLHRMDWRTTDAPVCELLWSPPKERETSQPSHTVMMESGCVCLIAGSSMTMFAVDSCVIELGSADVRGKLSAVACGPMSWSFATLDPSAKMPQSSVILVEPFGNYYKKLREKELQESMESSAQKVDKDKKKKEKKKEVQGKKPSAGKCSSCRNSGR